MRKREASLFPLFIKLAGRKVVLVGGGRVAASKLDGLVHCGAQVTVVSPEVRPEIERAGIPIVRRGFEASDLDGAWFAVAAATADVNRRVAAAGLERRIFVNAVDDPANASAYAGGVLRRGSVTVAISTEGKAPALAGLIRQALGELIPEQVEIWVEQAQREKRLWRRDEVPMSQRRPLLLAAINRLYAGKRAS